MDVGRVIAIGALAPSVAIAGIGTGIALDRALDQGGEEGSQAADAAVTTAAFTLGTVGISLGAALLLSKGQEFGARVGGAALAAVGIGSLAALGVSLLDDH